MEEKIDIRLDPDLISSKAFKDPFRGGDEFLTYFNLIERVNHERPGEFLELTEDELTNQIINERIDSKLKRRLESSGEDSRKNDAEKYQNIFEEPQEQEAEEAAEETSPEGEVVNGNQEILRQITAWKKTMEGKAELMGLVKASLNEASLTLDFMSLLATSLKPNSGKMLMSPHLKQHIPLGSLSSDRIPLSLDTETIRRGETVDKKALISWKLESLDNATTLINKRSHFLRKEVEKEKKYFQNLSKVSTFVRQTAVDEAPKSYQEVLFKMSERSIAIKYGYQDSGSAFKLNRGVAALKRGQQHGELRFQRLINNKFSEDVSRSEVQVKVFEKVNEEYILCSVSKVGEVFEDRELEVEGLNFEEIQKQIVEARHQIFEEELFYQLVKEAKILLPYGVKIVSNSKIAVELEDERIEIQYGEEKETEVVEAPDNNSELQKDLQELVKNNQKADYIVNLLRLLLCDYHRNNLYTMKYNSIPVLLRVIIGHINHERFVNKLVKRLVQLYHVELGMGLKGLGKQADGAELVTFKVTKHTTLEKENVFRAVSQAPRTSVTATFADHTVVLTVKTSSPLVYCDCLVNIQAPHLGLDVNYSGIGEIIRCLKWIATGAGKVRVVQPEIVGEHSLVPGLVPSGTK